MIASRMRQQLEHDPVVTKVGLGVGAAILAGGTAIIAANWNDKLPASNFPAATSFEASAPLAKERQITVSERDGVITTLTRLSTGRFVVERAFCAHDAPLTANSDSGLSSPAEILSTVAGLSIKSLIDPHNYCDGERRTSEQLQAATNQETSDVFRGLPVSALV